MLQQFSSASSCIRTRIVMGQHCTGWEHSSSFVPNGPKYFFFVFRVYF
jgi:hypothetical protein